MDDMSGGVSQEVENEDEEQAMQQAPATGEGDRPQSLDGENPDIGAGNEPQPGKGDKPVDLAEAEATVKANEQKQLEQIQEDIKNAIKDDPQLKELEKNLKIDQTEDGIRIQLLDQEKISMFPSGSAAMNPRSMELLAKVAEVVKTLPNKIEISGHTDAKPYAGGVNYTNWELSADRANASRRVLVGAGINPDRLTMIKGRADTDPFVKTDPFDPQNRRISIVLLREKKPEPAPSDSGALRSAPVPEPTSRSGPPEELVP
jgi:chemotaxis protein MotB